MWINPKIHFKPCAFATGCLSNEQNAYFLPLPTIFVLILGYVASAYSLFPTQISHGKVGFAVVTILTLKRPWLNITKVCFSIPHMHCWVGGMRSAPCATRSLRDGDSTTCNLIHARQDGEEVGHKAQTSQYLDLEWHRSLPLTFHCLGLVLGPHWTARTGGNPAFSDAGKTGKTVYCCMLVMSTVTCFD